MKKAANVLIWIGPYIFIQAIYLLSDTLVFGRPYYVYNSIPMIVMIGLCISFSLAKEQRITALSMGFGVLYGIYSRTSILQHELVTGRRTMSSEIMFYKYIFISAIIGMTMDAVVPFVKKGLSKLAR